jgi:hypothetical protein
MRFAAQTTSTTTMRSVSIGSGRGWSRGPGDGPGYHPGFSTGHHVVHTMKIASTARREP